MCFKGAMVLPQVPDMHMMHARDAIVLLQGPNDLIELDLIGHRSHQQAGLPGGAAGARAPGPTFLRGPQIFNVTLELTNISRSCEIGNFNFFFFF